MVVIPSQQPDKITQAPTDQQRRKHQADGPGQRAGNQHAHRCGVVGERGAKIQGQKDPLEERAILFPQRTFQPKHLRHRLAHRFNENRIHRRTLRHEFAQHRFDWIAGDKARHKKDNRDADPDDKQIAKEPRQ